MTDQFAALENRIADASKETQDTVSTRLDGAFLKGITAMLAMGAFQSKDTPAVIFLSSMFKIALKQKGFVLSSIFALLLILRPFLRKLYYKVFRVPFNRILHAYQVYLELPVFDVTEKKPSQ